MEKVEKAQRQPLQNLNKNKKRKGSKELDQKVVKMKIRVTKKTIQENYKNIIVAGYCDLQYLLYFKNANFNTSGVYGWNADIYEINYNTVIVTGYRPFGNVRKYGLAKKYDEKAKKIVLNYNMKYETKVKKLEKLIEKFVNESIENNEI